jgi:hypothetical protein
MPNPGEDREDSRAVHRNQSIVTRAADRPNVPFAMGLRLVKAGEDSGVLVFVWAQEGGAWKIVAYNLMTS